MGLFDMLKVVFSVGHPRHDAAEVDGRPSLAAMIAWNNARVWDQRRGPRRGWMDSWMDPRDL